MFKKTNRHNSLTESFGAAGLTTLPPFPGPLNHWYLNAWQLHIDWCTKSCCSSHVIMMYIIYIYIYYICIYLSLIVILLTYIMHIHIPLYCSLFNHPSWYLLVIRICRTNIASTRSQIELYCFEMLWSVLNIFKNLLYFIIPLLDHHGGISQQWPVGEWLVRLNFGTFQSLILTAELKVTPHRASTSNKICSTSQSRQRQVRGAEVARDSCDKIRFKG